LTCSRVKGLFVCGLFISFTLRLLFFLQLLLLSGDQLLGGLLWLLLTLRFSRLFGILRVLLTLRVADCHISLDLDLVIVGFHLGLTTVRLLQMKAFKDKNIVWDNIIWQHRVCTDLLRQKDGVDLLVRKRLIL